MAGFREAGLPALLVYKGGQMVTSALRCTAALPKAFTDIDVARLLQAKGILTVPTGVKELAAHLVTDQQSNRQWSDDENEEAAEENSGATVALQGLNLLAADPFDAMTAGSGSGSKSSSSAAAAASSSSSSRSGGGRLQKGKFTRSRIADSDDDSD
jgi:hypothetical protein